MFMDDNQLISNFGETAPPHRIATRNSTDNQLISNFGKTAPPPGIETRNSTDMDISRGVPEVDTAISHSRACSNGIHFVELKETLSLHVSCFF